MNIDSIKKSLHPLTKSNKKSICLVFSTVLSEDTCQQLLNITGITGILMPPGSQKRPQNIGTLNESKPWTLPDPKPDLFVCVNKPFVFLLDRNHTIKNILKIIFFNHYTLNHTGIEKNKIITQIMSRTMNYIYKKLNFHYVHLTTQLFAQIGNVNRPLNTAKGSVIVSYSLAPGGAERQVVNSLKGLAQKNIFPELWCTHLNGNYGFYRPLLPPQTPVATVDRMVLDLMGDDDVATEINKRRNVFHHLKTQLPADVFSAVLNFSILFLHKKPAVVHTWQDYTNITAGLAAAVSGVPKIVMGTRNMTPRHFDYNSPVMKPIYQFLTQHPHVVLLNNSHAGAKDYENWLALPRNNIKVIHNGVYPGKRLDETACFTWKKSHHIQANQKIVGTIARFYNEKAPELWLNCARRIAKRHPDCMFLMIGDGPLRPKIERRIARHGLQARFLMLGNIADISAPLSCMDVFLMTSKFEGLPNVLIEAQMMGVPVITTEAGGAEETLENGVTGHLAHTRKASELADYVITELEQETLAKNRTNIKKTAQQRFGVDQMVEKTLSLYRD